MSESDVEKVVLKALVHRGKKFIEIDGQAYVLNEESPREHPGKRNKEVVTLAFTKVDLKEYDKTIEEMAEKLRKKVDTKELLKQSLYALPHAQIVQIKEELLKAVPKVRRHKGCLYLTVGDNKIPLRD